MNLSSQHSLTLCILFFFVLTFAFPSASQAQQAKQCINSEQIVVTTNKMAQNCYVQFNAATEIANLMVIIWDKKGNLVYHESRFNFTGNYERTIDLQGYASGAFDMKIVADDQRIPRKLSWQ